MNKRIVFYDKWSGGHRPYIQKVITDFLRPTTYTFKIVTDPHGQNSLAFLCELAQREKFDHCHIMTLDDCLEDFCETEKVLWLQRANITFSATLYKFTFLRSHIMLIKSLREYWYKKKFKATLRVMNSGIMNIVAVPDERISQIFVYPVWRNKLRILPDPAAFSNEPVDAQRAKLYFGWDPYIPTILMFGYMYKQKGLNLLIDALSEKFSHYYLSPFQVILAGPQIDGRQDVALSSAVKLIEYDRYIDQIFAKQLFAVADCVVMPFVEGWEYSSITFSLACASGNFIITPNRGVLGWRIKNFGNGYVYQPGDSASLASIIARFVEKYPELSFPIEGSVKYAATCTPSRYISVIDGIIKESIHDAC